MATQDNISLFYWMRTVAGTFFMAGLIVYLGSFFIKGQAAPTEEVPGPAPQERVTLSGRGHSLRPAQPLTDVYRA